MRCGLSSHFVRHTSVANTYRCLFSSSFPPAATAIDATAASIDKITSNITALLLRYTSLSKKLYYLQVQPAYLILVVVVVVELETAICDYISAAMSK
jgi:hypothetical protein